MPICSRHGCTTVVKKARQFCDRHLEEVRPCGVEGCERPLGVHNRSGYCTGHRKMARKSDR